MYSFLICCFFSAKPSPCNDLLQYIFKELIEMQMKFFQSNSPGSAKLLLKSTSMPSFTETTYSSSNSIQSIDDQYRKSAIKWIISYNKKVTRDTQYLAISYLNRLITKAIYISEENYQKMAVTVLLIASKMNEIYPPKITSMLSKCKKAISKQQIIATEGKVVGAFDYEMATENTAFTYLFKILGSIYADKLQECQKLLRIVASFREIYQFGDEILAYAIIYLIIPQFIREMKLRDNQKVKTLAIKIYSIYNETKQKYQKEKENRCR